MDMKSHHLESMDTEPTESAEPTEGENLTATVPEAWLDEVEADTAEGFTEASGETHLPSGAGTFSKPETVIFQIFQAFLPISSYKSSIILLFWGKLSAIPAIAPRLALPPHLGKDKKKRTVITGFNQQIY